MFINATMAFLFSLLICPGPLLTVQAYPGAGGGWGPGSQYGRMYNPKTVETVEGEITKVERVVPIRGMHTGVHLLLKTNKAESLAVHLGPDWYVDKQEPKLSAGDKVQVRGSRITFDGKPAIIAAEVTKAGQTMHLRDADGVPAWAGRGRGRNR
jgi:hypothetical protein